MRNPTVHSFYLNGSDGDSLYRIRSRRVCPIVSQETTDQTSSDLDLTLVDAYARLMGVEASVVLNMFPNGNI